MSMLLALTKHRLGNVVPKPFASQEIRHLYRSILRATTYLPDSFARVYMREHVTKRFRQNSKKKSTVKIVHNRVKKARHACRVLERASDGEADALKDVLMRVYGRKGPRKRVLLEDLIRKDEDQVPKDDEALQELIMSPTGRQATDYEPGSKFFQFLRSQQANQPLEYHSNSVKQLQPKIPETNIWLRPIPLKAQKGLRQRWWTMTLDKLFPPVPRAEWDRLQGFATGKLRLEEALVRRASALSTCPDPEWSHDAKDVLEFLNHRAKRDRPDSERSWLDDADEEFDFVGYRPKRERLDTEFVKFDDNKGLCVHEKAKEDQVDKRSGPLSKRALRRLYGAIWNMTPTMEQDETTKQWNIIWGGHRSAAHNGEISKPSEAQKEFFEGLEGVHVSQKGGRAGGRNRKKIMTKNEASEVQNPLMG